MAIGAPSGFWTIKFIINDAKYVKPIAIKPDINPIIAVSATNRFDTSRFLPPSDLITPISFTLSTTDTYVMIAIITLETTSDNVVKPISAIVIILITPLIILKIKVSGSLYTILLWLLALTSTPLTVIVLSLFHKSKCSIKRSFCSKSLVYSEIILGKYFPPKSLLPIIYTSSCDPPPGTN